MNRSTAPPHARRRTISGLPVEGALAPRGPRVVRRRRTGAWLSLTVLLLVVVGGTVIWQLGRSDYFLVRHVRVSGARSVNQAAIVNAANVAGRQLYQLDGPSVAAAVERIPMVQSARMQRLWPNSVQIDITERQPWGTWQIGGVNYLVDENGAVLDIVSQPWTTNVYELDAAPGLQPGDHVDADALRAARVLIRTLPAAVAQQVAKLQYSAEGGLEIVTDRGVRVRLGDSQGLDYKLAVWQAVNGKVGAQQIHLIDLRSADRPYYR